MAGWSIKVAPNTSFVEAELDLREGYDDLETPIWFVAAPGAVGKSTLAKAISARTGAVYLDLAKAETVAGNYLTGGLVKNRLLDAWQANQATLLIDALDEARLRVTQSSFEDFLKDVETLARGRSLPADFRKDNGGAIRKVCTRFIMLCRRPRSKRVSPAIYAS
jgi:hypothetical protein